MGDARERTAGAMLFNELCREGKGRTWWRIASGFEAPTEKLRTKSAEACGVYEEGRVGRSNGVRESALKSEAMVRQMSVLLCCAVPKGEGGKRIGKALTVRKRQRGMGGFGLFVVQLPHSCPYTCSRVEGGKTFSYPPPLAPPLFSLFFFTPNTPFVPFTLIMSYRNRGGGNCYTCNQRTYFSSSIPLSCPW